MKLRPCSDLHMDPAHFDPYKIVLRGDEHECVLVVAGDAAERNNSVEWFINVCKHFKQVVWILGNHEFYGSNIKRMPEKFIQRMVELNGSVPSNFHLLNPGIIEIEDVVFIGATLWTDFNKGNGMLMYDAGKQMNDYKQIRHGPPNVPWSHKLRTEDVLHMHRSQLRFIEQSYEQHKGKKIVVVTHHAPCELSLHPDYKGHSLNGCYYTDLSEFIRERDIDVWVHGHIHHHVDYDLYGTRIIANPRGYVSTRYKHHEQTGFNPTFTIEL